MVVFERAMVLLFVAAVALERAAAILERSVCVLVVAVLPAGVFAVAGVDAEVGARLGEAGLAADLAGAVDWAARSRT